MIKFTLVLAILLLTSSTVYSGVKIIKESENGSRSIFIQEETQEKNSHSGLTVNPKKYNSFLINNKNNVKKIVMLGDSTSTGFTYKNFFNNFYSVINPDNIDNIFHSNDPQVSSVMANISKHFPAHGVNYSIPGISIIDRSAVKSAIGTVLSVSTGLQSMLEKVKDDGGPGDINIFWLGHNDIDWVEHVPPEIEQELTAKRKDFKTSEVDNYLKLVNGKYKLKDKTKMILDQEVVQTIDAYMEKVESFIQVAKKRNKKTAIVFCGLMNVERFVQLRNEYNSIAKKGLIPYFFESESAYKSMKYSFQDGLKYISRQFQEELKKRVAQVQLKNETTNLKIYYTDTTSNAILPSKEYMSEVDGWHYSKHGFSFMGNALYQGLNEAIRFIK